MSSNKDWYELRVREQVASNRWVKKSKFYEVSCPKDAVRIYGKHSKVPFTVMWCSKNDHHDNVDRLQYQCDLLLRELRLEEVSANKNSLGVTREFFKLGNSLLRELGQKEKNKRRYYAAARKETAD